MIVSVIFLLACHVLLINVIVRCADGRIGINGTAGIRTATIMTNEQTWLAGHKAAKKPTLTGIYTAMAFMSPALFVSQEAWQATFLLGSCLIVFIGVLIGAYKGSKAARLVLTKPR